MSDKANDIQVGGEHYGLTDYQHWDWAVDVNMGPILYGATKYIVRYGRKGGEGLIGLNKARHYIDKHVELADLGKSLYTGPILDNLTVRDLTAKLATSLRLHRYVEGTLRCLALGHVEDGRSMIDELAKLADTLAEPKPVPIEDSNRHAERYTQEDYRRDPEGGDGW